MFAWKKVEGGIGGEWVSGVVKVNEDAVAGGVLWTVLVGCGLDIELFMLPAQGASGTAAIAADEYQ